MNKIVFRNISKREIWLGEWPCGNLEEARFHEIYHLQSYTEHPHH